MEALVCDGCGAVAFVRAAEGWLALGTLQVAVPNSHFCGTDCMTNHLVSQQARAAKAETNGG